MKTDEKAAIQSSPAENSLADDFEFFIPVHGFVNVTEDELAIINHPAFQRLGNIFQLGQSNLVYRGATHMRLEHVLGVVHVAQQMIDSITENHARFARRVQKEQRCALCEVPGRTEIAFIRLAALIHDIGHIACGHTLEDELEFLPKHDHKERLDLVLKRQDWPWGLVESLCSIIDRNYAKYLAETDRLPSDVVIALVAKSSMADLPNLRINVCKDIVGNTICADILDYLYRDFHHIGKPKYFEKRIFHYMEIRSNPLRGGRPEFVISLGERGRRKTDAITCIVDLLECRYHLAESVLFHRTKCSASAMLERAIQEIYIAIPSSDRKKWTTDIEIRLLDCSDAGMLALLIQEAGKFQAQTAINILNSLRARSIFRQAYTFSFADNPVTGKALQGIYTKTQTPEGTIITSAETASHNRLTTAKRLEEDFGLPPGTVAIYSPSKGMNAKIAKVKLHIDGNIDAFNEWAVSNTALGGDHHAAQIKRFHNLWKFHVCVDRREWDSFSEEERSLFADTVEKLVIGLGESGPEAAIALANRAIRLPRFTGFKVTGLPLAARGTAAKYPMSYPTLRSLISKG